MCVLSGVTFADTLTVDDDGKADFDNIQAAVDADEPQNGEREIMPCDLARVTGSRGVMYGTSSHTVCNFCMIYPVFTCYCLYLL